MLSLIIICIIAGAFGSILQGIIGIGTGVIIVPLLTFLLPDYGISQENASHIALATSMAAIAINSITALISHQRHQNIQWPVFNKMVLFSLLGAGLGAFGASYVSGFYLEGIYGLFLLVIAALMLIQRSIHEPIDDMPVISFPKLATGGLGVGFIGSVLGSGGGILMVPLLHKFKVKMRYAVGTSTLIGLPISLMGTMTYSIMGATKATIPFVVGYIHWPALLACSLAGLICAPLGVKLASKLPNHIVRKIFAYSMIVVGLKMIHHLSLQ
ncbi:MAG: sulfite exporter TauE/SafE family protein [Candidatus Berkiella sp.]